MKIRRIVTGHDSAGKSVFVPNSRPYREAAFTHVPGLFGALLWDTPPNPQLREKVVDPAPSLQPWVPEPGGTKLMLIVFPPDSVMTSPTFNPMAAGAEYAEKLPGLAEKFEADAPGMHTTASIDYGIVLEGEVHLELDDGQVKKLRRHDIIVQNGTRHAWPNPGSEPVTMLFVLVGATTAAAAG